MLVQEDAVRASAWVSEPTPGSPFSLQGWMPRAYFGAQSAELALAGTAAAAAPWVRRVLYE